MTTPSRTHQTHSLFPGQPFIGNEGHCNEGINAQAGGNSEGIAGDEAKGNGHYACSQCGDCSNRGDAQAAPVEIFDVAENQRVEQNNVGHREEGDYATAYFGQWGRSALGNLKESIECGSVPAVLLGGRCRGILGCLELSICHSGRLPTSKGREGTSFRAILFHSQLGFSNT